MQTKQTTAKEPLFHVVKRADVSVKTKILIYAVSVVTALLIGSILCGIFSQSNPFAVLGSLVSGAFKTERKIKVFIQDFALLLLVSMAVVPAFRMHFWNLGANGQMLAGCLASAACMFYLGGKVPDGVVNIIMIVSAIAAGILWAVIPALFKAYFGTNETLFTLMMNYIAEGLVAFCVSYWATDGSGVLRPMSDGKLPMIVNQYFAVAFVAVLITGAITVYLRYGKHGYEIDVVGESVNTAKYIGINVKKVMIRTLVLSGAVCGVVGLLLTGGINHTVNSELHGGMGFTSIMTVWLAKFKPALIVATCFFVTFITKGMAQVRMDFGFTDSATADIVLGIVYFCIIACDFFVNYRILFRHKQTKTSDGVEGGSDNGTTADKSANATDEVTIDNDTTAPQDATDKEATAC